jgi:hypothetical protein
MEESSPRAVSATGRGRNVITVSRDRDRSSERRAGWWLHSSWDGRVPAEAGLGRLNDSALSPAPG